MVKTIAFASDHAGFPLKEKLKEYAAAKGYKVLDLGTNSSESVDYPDYGYKLAAAIEKGFAEFGVAVCGSGIGISIAANRNPSVRAALCHDVNTASLAREHNDANVLAMGARIVSEDLASQMLDKFLNTEFAQGRHENRVKKLGQYSCS